MDPYNNLNPSLFHPYHASTSQNDSHQEYRTLQVSQNYDMFQRPPGAETRGLPPPIQPRHGTHSLQDTLPRGHSEIAEHTSRMSTPFPILSQSNESNNTLYVSSPSRSPSPSHVYHPRIPAPQFERPPTSQLTPYDSSNLSRCHHSTHLRASSQPSPTSTPILGDENGPARASQYSGTPQVTTPLSSLSIATTQSIPLPAPPGVHFPVLPPPGFPRRYSEADMSNAQTFLMPLYTHGHSPAPTTYSPFPEQSSFSPKPSNAQSFTPGFTDVMSGSSSQAHGAGGRILPFDDPYQSSALSDSPEDMTGPMFPDPPSAVTPGTPSHIPDHSLLPPATSSMNLQPEGPQRRPGKGRRETPKDLRATTRLSDQRKSDDENIEALWKLFVPAGTEVRWKKERLGMILDYAVQLVDRYNRLLEYYERDTGAREGQLAQSDEGPSRNQGQLPSRNGDFTNTKASRPT